MKKKLISILSILIIILFLFPLLYTLLHSFMGEYDIMSANGRKFIPEFISLGQYIKLTKITEFFKLYSNSILISICIIAGQCIVSIFTAYFFARTKGKTANVIFILYIFFMILPLQITLIPNVFLFNWVGDITNFNFFDSWIPIIISGIFNTFGVFFLKQFFSGIPEKYFEIAKTDGASDLTILFKIVIPYSGKAILALCCLIFIDTLNIIEQALVFVDTPSKKTISLYLDFLYTDDKSVFFASSILYIFPIIFIVSKAKNMIEGYLTQNINNEKA